MTKTYKNWVFVAAVFQILFAGYVLGMTNNKLSEAAVAVANLEGREVELERLLTAATDPEAKRDLGERQAKLAEDRAAVASVKMQASALGQSIAVGTLVVAGYCLLVITQWSTWIGRLRPLAWIMNLGALSFIGWSTYLFLTSPYDTSSALGNYSFCAHLVVAVLAVLSSRLG